MTCIPFHMTGTNSKTALTLTIIWSLATINM
jgi:hypothetical protein